VGLSEYRQRLDAYNSDIKANLDAIHKTKVYSMLRPKAIKPPQVMSIICQGVELDFGNTIEISPVRVYYEATNFYSNNPYLSAFAKLDVSVVLLWVLSLAGLLLSFDAISGEGERGTLKLILSTRVSKVKLFLAKYLGSLICVGVLALISVVAAMVFFALSESIGLSLSLFFRFVKIFGVVVLYCGIWVGIGTLLSLVFRSSEVSLIGCLGVWVLLLIVVPNVVNHLGDDIDLDEAKEIVRREDWKLSEEFWRKKSKLQKSVSRWFYGQLTWYEPGEEQIYIEGTHPKTLIGLKRYFGRLYP